MPQDMLTAKVVPVHTKSARINSVSKLLKL